MKNLKYTKILAEDCTKIHSKDDSLVEVKDYLENNNLLDTITLLAMFYIVSEINYKFIQN